MTERAKYAESIKRKRREFTPEVAKPAPRKKIDRPYVIQKRFVGPVSKMAPEDDKARKWHKVGDYEKPAGAENALRSFRLKNNDWFFGMTAEYRLIMLHPDGSFSIAESW